MWKLSLGELNRARFEPYVSDFSWEQYFAATVDPPLGHALRKRLWSVIDILLFITNCPLSQLVLWILKKMWRGSNHTIPFIHREQNWAPGWTTEARWLHSPPVLGAVLSHAPTGSSAAPHRCPHRWQVLRQDSGFQVAGPKLNWVERMLVVLAMQALTGCPRNTLAALSWSLL